MTSLMTKAGRGMARENWNILEYRLNKVYQVAYIPGSIPVKARVMGPQEVAVTVGSENP